MLDVTIWVVFMLSCRSSQDGTEDILVSTVSVIHVCTNA